MIAKMNHSILDNWIGGIIGVFGFGVCHTLLQVPVYMEVVKLGISLATAFLAGGAGVAGKYAFVWCQKKIKAYFKKPNKP